MAGLPGCERSLKICLLLSIECAKNVRRTDGHTPHDGISCAMHSYARPSGSPVVRYVRTTCGKMEKKQSRQDSDEAQTARLQAN